MNADRTVREIMTTDLVTVSPDKPAAVVQDIFRANNFHHIPVVERGGLLVGIISKEDLYRVAEVLAWQANGNNPAPDGGYARLTAADVMTKYPICLDPEDTIGLAADIFLANKFHALPIVEDERLVGLVTTHDLLKYGFNSTIIEKEEEAFEEEI